MDDGRFNYYLQIYRNDLRLKRALKFEPEEVPHVDPELLEWEMEIAYNHLEEMIPQSHLDACNRLL